MCALLQQRLFTWSTKYDVYMNQTPTFAEQNPNPLLLQVIDIMMKFG